MKNNRGKKKVGARASVSGAGAEQERLRKRCERHRFGWACFLSLLVVFLAGLLGPGMAADGISALSKAVPQRFKNGSTVNHDRQQCQWFSVLRIVFPVVVANRGLMVHKEDVTEEEADEFIIQLWPLTDYEFAATIKALWWYGHCSTVGSCRRLICSWVNSGIDAVSKKVGKVASRDFKLMYDPRIVHKVMYDGVMDVIQRHVGPTGGRVHQMFPAEIREGLGALSPQIARHMLIGSYVSLMSTVARRNPTMATLRWRELSFVKTASMIDGKLHHIFGTVIRWTSEKNMDMHGMRISSVDPSGDENCVEDANVGIRPKGSRAFRRNLVSTKVEEALATGREDALPGLLQSVGYLGGWASQPTSTSVLYNIYAAQTAHMAASQSVNVCAGRDATSSRVGQVRLLAMQAFTSALVHGGLELRRLLLSQQHIGFPTSFVIGLLNDPEVLPAIRNLECVTRGIMDSASAQLLTSRDLCPHQMLRLFMEKDPVFSTALTGNCLSSFGRSDKHFKRICDAEKIHGRPLSDTARRFVLANSAASPLSQQAVASWRDNPQPGSCAMSTLFSTMQTTRHCLVYKKCDMISQKEVPQLVCVGAEQLKRNMAASAEAAGLVITDWGPRTMRCNASQDAPCDGLDHAKRDSGSGCTPPTPIVSLNSKANMFKDDRGNSWLYLARGNLGIGVRVATATTMKADVSIANCRWYICSRVIASDANQARLNLVRDGAQLMMHEFKKLQLQLFQIDGSSVASNEKRQTCGICTGQLKLSDNSLKRQALQSASVSSIAPIVPIRTFCFDSTCRLWRLIRRVSEPASDEDRAWSDRSRKFLIMQSTAQWLLSRVMSKKNGQGQGNNEKNAHDKIKEMKWAVSLGGVTGDIANSAEANKAEARKLHHQEFEEVQEEEKAQQVAHSDPARSSPEAEARKLHHQEFEEEDEEEAQRVAHNNPARNSAYRPCPRVKLAARSRLSLDLPRSPAPSSASQGSPSPCRLDSPQSGVDDMHVGASPMASRRAGRCVASAAGDPRKALSMQMRSAVPEARTGGATSPGVCYGAGAGAGYVNHFAGGPGSGTSPVGSLLLGSPLVSSTHVGSPRVGSPLVVDAQAGGRGGGLGAREAREGGGQEAPGCQSWPSLAGPSKGQEDRSSFDFIRDQFLVPSRSSNRSTSESDLQIIMPFEDHDGAMGDELGLANVGGKLTNPMQGTLGNIGQQVYVPGQGPREPQQSIRRSLDSKEGPSPRQRGQRAATAFAPFTSFTDPDALKTRHSRSNLSDRASSSKPASFRDSPSSLALSNDTRTPSKQVSIAFIAAIAVMAESNSAMANPRNDSPGLSKRPSYADSTFITANPSNDTPSPRNPSYADSSSLAANPSNDRTRQGRRPSYTDSSLFSPANPSNDRPGPGRHPSYTDSSLFSPANPSNDRPGPNRRPSYTDSSLFAPTNPSNDRPGPNRHAPLTELAPQAGSVVPPWVSKIKSQSRRNSLAYNVSFAGGEVDGQLAVSSSCSVAAAQCHIQNRANRTSLAFPTQLTSHFQEDGDGQLPDPPSTSSGMSRSTNGIGSIASTNLTGNSASTNGSGTSASTNASGTSATSNYPATTPLTQSTSSRGRSLRMPALETFTPPPGPPGRFKI
eukprot:gene22380-29485_t